MALVDVLGDFDGLSLDALDERAALLRRVDNKYALTEEAFSELTRRLKPDHQVLDIEGRRVFSYSTTYFETQDLRCFIDHVKDRVPRFKARTRLYEDHGKCIFEVKLKRSRHMTQKRQIDYAQEDRRRLTDEARACVQSTLEKADVKAPDSLSASLTTSFDRVTFAARSGSERLTCDFGVQLTGSDGEAVAMRDGLVLIETKSQAGESPADHELTRMGFTPISLSKYRVGMSIVGGADRFGDQPGGELFEP
jgi:VTC domain